MKNLNLKLIAVLTLFTASFAAAQSPVPDASYDEAVKSLQAGLSDKTELALMLDRLSTTENISLLPVFAKLMRNEDDRVRLLATGLVFRLAGKQAIPLLRDRLFNDPAMRVRGEALSQLLKIGELTDQELVQVANMNDVNVQVVACNALASRGQFNAVKPLLEHLVKSGMTDVSTFASMTLLAHGDNSQVQFLRSVLLDKQTQPELIISMLNQIRREKILPAMPVAQYAANSYDMLPVRIRGFMAIDAMAPDAANILCNAIKNSQNLTLNINLMRMLASRKDSDKQLKELSGRNDIIGDLARFEIARRSGASSAGQYLQKLLGLAHPIIVEYVYQRAESDLEEKRNVEFYVAPLAGYITSQELSSTRITPMHTLLATGISVLGDIQLPSSDKVLAEIFSRPDNDPLKQLAIVSLYATPNKQVAAMAKPCLKSPYPDTKAYAAMLLARFNDPAAIPALLEVQLARPTTEPDVMALVDWYLLQFAGSAKTTQAVETITRSLR